jgi:hypothetical protein
MRSPSLARQLWKTITRNFDLLYSNRTFVDLTLAELVRLLYEPRLNLEPLQEKSMIEEWMQASYYRANNTRCSRQCLSEKTKQCRS